MIARLFPRVLAAYLRFALGTTRWRVVGQDNLAPYEASGPVVFAVWHERLALAPALWLAVRKRAPGRRAAALVSRHRDGRLIGEVLTAFGVDTVHGSTARGAKPRGGVAGARGLLAALAAGHATVITPDGPRGPARQARRGVASLAALSGAPVLPMAAQTARRRRLKSWDRMVFPLPFSTGVIVCGPALAVREGDEQAALARIEAALNAVCDAADRACC